MQLKKFITVIALFFVLVEGLVLGQVNHISGRVIDGSNGLPVEYANIGIVGTYLGTATDAGGNYEINANSLLRGREITVSAVGYRTRVLKIQELQKGEMSVIELIPVTYGINEVDIMAPSRIFYGMLKVAVRQIPNNYLDKAYSANALYQETGEGQHRHLNVLYTDADGYGKRSFTNAFLSRKYQIKSGTRDFEAPPFEKGLVRIEELLKFDVLRTPGNVLDTTFLKYFEVFEKEKYVTQGKHILVLGFECSHPEFAWTGDSRVRTMSGEIHIAQEDLSIVKTLTHYVSDGRFRHGRFFFTSEEMRDISVSRIEYSVETQYKPVEGKLVLSEVKWKNRVFAKDGAQPGEVTYKLSFNDVRPGETAIKKFRRHYYDDVSEVK